jgi:CheY-like chemotaxis protein
MPQVPTSLNIQRVKVVDDDKSARESIALCVEDAEFTPALVDGPLFDLALFVASTLKEADAIVCDHRLRRSIYANFDGAEAVARFYQANFPAVLCTAWSKADIDSMRIYRRYIPSLIPTDKLNPETIIRGFELCIGEFNNHFTTDRKPWRTLLRIEEVDLDSKPQMLYVTLPGWNSKEIVRLPFDLIPREFHANLKLGMRFHAETNKGTDNQDDLYFYDFDFR